MKAAESFRASHPAFTAGDLGRALSDSAPSGRRLPVEVPVGSASDVALVCRSMATVRKARRQAVLGPAIFSTVRDGLIVRIDEVFSTTRTDDAACPFARSDDALPSADG